jgi:hypothetical protein
MPPAVTPPAETCTAPTTSGVLARIPTWSLVLALVIVVVAGGIVIANSVASLDTGKGGATQPGLGATVTTPGTSLRPDSRATTPTTTSSSVPSAPGPTKPASTGSGATGPGATAPTGGGASVGVEVGGTAAATQQSGTFPAPYTGSGPSNHLVTTAVMHQVAATTWSGFSAALVANDVSALARYTTPDAGKAVRGALLKGNDGNWPASYSAVAYSDPPQKRYPLSFLAEFSGENYQQRPLKRDVIFVQASKDAPWLIASLGSYISNGSALFENTQAITTPPIRWRTTTLTSAPTRLVKLFQQVDTTGEPTADSAGFITFRTLLPTLLTTSERTYRLDKGEKLTSTWTHSVKDVTPRFLVSNGPQGETVSGYECFMMQLTHVATAPSGYVFQQQWDGRPYTTALAPGTYASISETDLLDVCFLNPPTGLAAGVSVFTQLGGPVTVTGTEGQGAPISALPTAPTATTTTTVPKK